MGERVESERGEPSQKDLHQGGRGTEPVKVEKKVVQMEKSGDGKGGDGERQQPQSILKTLIWTSSWEGTKGFKRSVIRVTFSKGLWLHYNKESEAVTYGS